MIVDVHCHVLPKAVAEKTEALFRQRTGDRNLFDFSISKLLEVMGTIINKACINNVVLRGDLVPRANDWTAQQVREHPDRLVGLYAPNPDFPDQAGELERCIKELGFKGVKINPSLMHYYPEDERMRPFWEKANELKVPVLSHGGRNVEDFNVKKLDSVRRYCEPTGFRPIVESYPDITFIVAHFAGFEDFPDEAIKLITDYPNVYTDMSMMFKRHSVERIAKVIRTVGAEKIMYGSDYPGYDARLDIEQIKALDISEEERRLILGENAVRVFGLD